MTIFANAYDTTVGKSRSQAIAKTIVEIEKSIIVDGLDGRKLVRDAFALPQTGGWVNYTIVNPVSKKTEAKTSYIEAMEDNLVLGCGVYQVE